ncbi:MAG: protease inhibitor I42 family protein [Planctomycetes bacterium]|nr:protease inhibitor I42 family protein [Planctomycetota bacterium]
MTGISHSLKRSGVVGFMCFLVGGCPLVAGLALVFDEGDSGSTITAQVGQKLKVVLDSNASTGYEWELTDLDPLVVEHSDTVYQGCSVPIPGCGGTETWTFTALSPGSTVLRLIYHRPWEDSEPAATFELTVTVTPAG